VGRLGRSPRFKIFRIAGLIFFLSFLKYNPDMSSFTYEQVAEHNTKDDLYMIIHNKVYNISKFVDEVSSLFTTKCLIPRTFLIDALSCQHPGGEEVLLDEGAKDATESFEDVGHSDEARELLEK